MKITIVGANGMLGTDLARAVQASDFDVVGLDLPVLDITDPKSVERNLPRSDWVVNCAAYTRVDDAETHREEAFAVNGAGAGNVARVCKDRGMRLAQMSTDYVFDGLKQDPYGEEDAVNPLSVYGASKLVGEQAVKAAGGHYLIIRTQSLFGVKGANFVRSIVQRALKSSEPLRVVKDQVSSPTYTRHLAAAIVRLIMLGKSGVVHVVAGGACSWADFAKAIVARVKPEAVVRPITAAELARPAPRPANSVMDTSRYRTWTGQTMPTWQQGLDEYLAEDKFA